MTKKGVSYADILLNAIISAILLTTTLSSIAHSDTEKVLLADLVCER